MVKCKNKIHKNALKTVVILFYPYYHCHNT